MEHVSIFFKGNGLGQAINVLSLLTHINVRRPDIRFKVISRVMPGVELIDFRSAIADIINTFGITSFDYANAYEPEEGDYVIDTFDGCKVFSPYLKTSSYIKDGKEIELDYNRGKRYIALAMHSFLQSEEIDREIPVDGTVFPFNRYYYFKDYQKIFELIIRSGFDVITLNSFGQPDSLANTVEILDKCEALISYEGGLAHLAHTINLPCIMLPWRENPDIAEVNAHLNRPMALHLDRKTYILNSIDEIVEWNKEKLLAVIDGLYDEQGNNKLMGSSKVRYVESTVEPGKMIFTTEVVPVGLSDAETAFIAKYLKLPMRAGG
jgi:hypothetical protein